MTRDEIHPELKRAMEAIELPEVQNMMKRLAEYGLAIGVPHMHGEEGGFLPLPADMISLEDGLRVSFRHAADPEVQTAIPVMWRYGWDADKGVATAKCVIGSCKPNWHHTKR